MRPARTVFGITLGVLLVWLGLSPSASAQMVGGGDLIHQFEGGSVDDQLGYSVAGRGDVDGDGFDDIILGANGCQDAAGAVSVYSGRTGERIWHVDGLHAGDLFGQSVSSAGDLDGDHFDEFIVGAPGTENWWGSASVFSGATGTLLWEFHGTTDWERLGTSVAGAGDVDEDGFDDVIVGAPGALADAGGVPLEGAGAVTVYSGATGLPIWEWLGEQAGQAMGQTVASAGDVDGDSVPDIVLGYGDPGGTPPSARIYSGASGALLWEFLDSGEIVAGAGDVDGDGFDDVILGHPVAAPNGLREAGSAYVYSGATGAMIWRFDGETARERFGECVSTAGDLDDDGRAEVLVGSHQLAVTAYGPRGGARLYEGATGRLLAQFAGVGAGDRLGAVAAAGHVDADNVPDIVIGAHDADVGGMRDAGAAYVYSFHPFLEASAEQVSATSGVPVTLTLDFPDSEAGARYAILASFSGTGPTVLAGTPVPLTRDFLLNQMTTGWVPPVLQGSLDFLDANGNGTAEIISDAWLNPYVGYRIHLIAVTLQPGVRMSSVARPLDVMY